MDVSEPGVGKLLECHVCLRSSYGGIYIDGLGVSQVVVILDVLLYKLTYFFQTHVLNRIWFK